MAANDALPLTVGRLRQELQVFAEGALRIQLQTFTTSIQQFLKEANADDSSIESRSLNGEPSHNKSPPSTSFHQSYTKLLREQTWRQGTLDLSDTHGSPRSVLQLGSQGSCRPVGADISEIPSHHHSTSQTGSSDARNWVLHRRSPLVQNRAKERRRGSVGDYHGHQERRRGSVGDYHGHPGPPSQRAWAENRFKKGTTGSFAVIAESDEEHAPMLDMEKAVPRPRSVGAKPASRAGIQHRGSVRKNVVKYTTARSASVLYSIDAREGIAEDIEPIGTGEVRVACTLQQVVKGQTYEQWNCLLIFASAVLIGVQTDQMARTWSRDVPTWTTIMDHALLVWFTCDIALRLCVDGCNFFCSANWIWNWLDLLVVCVQLADMFASTMVFGHRYLHMLRLARGVKMIRVFRVARQLKAVQGIRALLVSIEHSVKSLASVVFIIFLQSFICGVFLTQIVTDYKIEAGDEHMEEIEELHFFWGTLDRSMLSLYEVLSDGIHWSEIAQPIAEHISPWMMVFFCCYIAFSLVTVMNVVTGVFVDSALTAASEERKEILLEAMVQLFLDLDVDGSGEVSEDEFLTQMESDDMKQFLRDIDLTPDDASALFDLIDCNGSGEIEAEELVAGLMRVTGNAKAFDLAVFMHDHTCRLHHINTRFDRLERILSKRSSSASNRDSTAHSVL